MDVNTSKHYGDANDGCLTPAGKAHDDEDRPSELLRVREKKLS